jgi:hypothetical protein
VVIPLEEGGGGGKQVMGPYLHVSETLRLLTKTWTILVRLANNPQDHDNNDYINSMHIPWYHSECLHTSSSPMLYSTTAKN